MGEPVPSSSTPAAISGARVFQKTLYFVARVVASKPSK